MWGRYHFGYPGGGALPLYEALYSRPALRHVLVRREQAAVHAAEGYARSTGRVGVVLVTSGPGVGNTITGLLDALLDLAARCTDSTHETTYARSSGFMPVRSMARSAVSPAFRHTQRHACGWMASSASKRRSMCWFMVFAWKGGQGRVATWSGRLIHAVTSRPGVKKLRATSKLIFTLFGAVQIGLGAIAIVTETHTAHTRGKGEITVVGIDAVWMGQTLMFLSALPLLVWVPKKWIGVAAVGVWLGLMLWIFGGIHMR